MAVKIGDRVVHMGRADTVGVVTALGKPKRGGLYPVWVKRDGWKRASAFMARDLSPAVKEQV